MGWTRLGNKPMNQPINEPIIEYLEELIKEVRDGGFNVKIAIGTDSQKRGRGYNFATVILVMMETSLGIDKDGSEIIKGKGAKVIYKKFWEEMKASTKEKKHREIEVLNQRMILEVSKSIEVAYEIQPLLDALGVKMEIHADINPDPERGLSNMVLKEAAGYIMGMGYDFKIKPLAYAASKAADKLC